MRVRLLLIVLVAIAGLGADCGGGSGSSSSSSSSLSTEGETGGDDLVSPVPEPSALVVFGAGLLVAGAVSRRKR